MSVVLSPPIFLQFFIPGTNQPASGYQVFTYRAGTSTKQATYTDSSQGTPNANPIILDANGVCRVWGDPTLNFKFVYAPPNSGDPPTTQIYTTDNFQFPLTASTVAAAIGGTGAAIGQAIWPITTFETAASVTPANYSYEWGDIRRYGALVANADNSSAITNALAVSSVGGKAAYIPEGTWKTTSAPIAAANSSMYGNGESSIIAPQGNIDGLAFASQTYYGGARFFRDFSIIGPSLTTNINNGINLVPNLGAGSQQITGVRFENLNIQNFAQAFYCNQVWECTFQNNFIYNVSVGYYFHGTNVLNNIIGGFIQRGTISAVGNLLSGTDYGIAIDPYSGQTTQSMHISGVGIYAFSYNIYAYQSLYMAIEHCDISSYIINGIQLFDVTGGTTVRDCWIQSAANAANPIGVNIPDIGAHITDPINVDGCKFLSNTTVVQSGSIGVYCGSGMDGISVTNCAIGSSAGPFGFGVKIGGANNVYVRNNKIFTNSGLTPYDVYVNSSSSNVVVGDNTSLNGTGSPAAVPLAYTVGTPPGLSYYGFGSFVAGLTGMNATLTATWSYVANGRMVSIYPAVTTGVSTATTMLGTGLPAVITPNSSRNALALIADNGTGNYGQVVIPTSGTMTFYEGANSNVFTGTGAKGVLASPIVYQLG